MVAFIARSTKSRVHLARRRAVDFDVREEGLVRWWEMAGPKKAHVEEAERTCKAGRSG